MSARSPPTTYSSQGERRNWLRDPDVHPDRPTPGYTTLLREAERLLRERDDYLDFCLDKWQEFGNELLQLGPPKAEAVRNYMQEHEGQLPPHVEITTAFRFSVRKA